MIDVAKLACDALGLAPIGRLYDGPDTFVCSLSGRVMGSGDWVAPFKPTSGFTDDLCIMERSGVISGYVAAIMQGPVLIRTQRAVFCADGAYSLAKDDDRAWLFINPPAPPWVAVAGTSIGQHLIWKTPPTLDNAIMQIRVGQENLVIRRAVLETALAAIKQERLDNPKFTNGFMSLDRDLKSPNHGIPRTDLPQHLCPLYASLTRGEIWALAALAKAKPVTPNTPERISLTRKQNENQD